MTSLATVLLCSQLCGPLTVPPVSWRDASTPALEAEERDEPAGTVFTRLRDDAVYLARFPTRRTRRGVLTAGAVLGGIGVLYTLDDEIRAEVQSARNPTLDRWEGRFEPLGQAGVVFVGAAAVWGAGHLADDGRLAETGRTLLEALLLTELPVKATKGLFGRDYPGSGARPSDFLQGSSAFPSGHTARAFAVASVLAREYGRPAAWTAYPIATLVGLAMIERDTHWASDVLAGGALGYAVGRAVHRRRSERADASASDANRISLAGLTVSAHGEERSVHLRFAF